MVTHELVLRGLPFEQAYAFARALRDRLSDRVEVPSFELEELIEAQLRESFESERLQSLAGAAQSRSLPSVVHPGSDPQPFSRGLLARSLVAAGLDIDPAYNIATDVQTKFHMEGVESIDNAALAREVGELLVQRDSAPAAAQYRMMRRIGRLPRPLVVYLAGATGTGKSTLALELAPLLRIYQINATDTIRQVMRMVFSPAILPGLHRSSFLAAERADLSEDALGGEQQVSGLVLRGFEDQATRVCVGVRAVVERALAENMSIIIEGVHLLPPLVPFADLEGAAYQVMLMLSTLDGETHRSHLLHRDGQGSRLAHHYLDNLSAIREVQEFLLLQAEQHDIPSLDTGDRAPLVSRALRLVAGTLEEQAPWIGELEGTPRRTPTLCLFIDGLADRPVRALGNRTPLEAAETPTLDRLAREGACGLADPIGPNIVPDTAGGALALFGQPEMSLQRGPVEALGVGLSLAPGDVALRGNFATLDDEGRVVDRRAGRIREGAEELAQELDHMELVDSDGRPVLVRVRAATEHRIAIVLKGEGLSSALIGSDPGEVARLDVPLPPAAREVGDAEATRTADLLSRFERRARGVLGAHAVNRQRSKEGLPVANAILTRGAGRVHGLSAVEPGGKAISMSCIGGDSTVLGVASSVGARTLSGEGMTANLDSDVRAKFHLALTEIEEQNLVVIHVKGADIAGHDRRPELKKEFLERLDRELAWFLEKRSEGLRIAVAADHATLSEVGRHGADPVPVLIWGEGVEADAVSAFSEADVVTGRLGRFPLRNFLDRFMSPSP